MNDPDADISKPDSTYKYIWNVPLSLYLWSENDKSSLYINDWLTDVERKSWFNISLLFFI